MDHTAPIVPAVGDLRVVGRIETRRVEEGYTCPDRVQMNVLQRYTGRVGRFFPHWRDVEHEDVPSHVAISVGCFGDTGGWLSRFQGQPGVVFPTRELVAAQRRVEFRSDLGFVLTVGGLAMLAVLALQSAFGG